MPLFKPAYIETSKKGLLSEKIQKAYEILESCTLCPRRCKVNRLSGETGICNTGEKAYVSSFNAHFGEEDPLVGTHGSGTIFLPTVICCAFSVRITKSATWVMVKRYPLKNLPI